jgi:hypothetical protein
MDPRKQALIQELMAEQEQQVPPGNPVADHYQKRADDLGTMAGTLMTGGGALAGLSLAEIVDGNPLALIPLLGAGVIGAGGGAGAQALGDMRQGTADMWFNRFGNNDPQQGPPGTPSGPAYRR